MSVGASKAGSVSVEPHPRRTNSAHTPAALDGPTGQSGIFSQRTELLGQVSPHQCQKICRAEGHVFKCLVLFGQRFRNQRNFNFKEENDKEKQEILLCVKLFCSNFFT